MSGGRAKTINVKALRRELREEREQGVVDLDLERLRRELEAERPKTRADCDEIRRPCPFFSCRWNLYLDVNPVTGSIKFNFPGLEFWELDETCALDVDDAGGVTLDRVGQLVNLSRERIRQVETSGLERPRDHAEMGENMPLAMEPNVGAIQGQVARAFAGEDRRRAELLDWLAAHGHGSVLFARIPAKVLERARRELGHPAPKPPPVVKTFKSGTPPHDPRMDRQCKEASHATSPGKPGSPPTPIAAPVNPEVEPARPAEEEKPMPAKVCSNCRTAKLRSDNESGICNACRRAPAKGRANGAAAAPARNDAKAERVKRTVVELEAALVEGAEAAARMLMRARAPSPVLDNGGTTP